MTFKPIKDTIKYKIDFGVMKICQRFADDIFKL